MPLVPDSRSSPLTERGSRRRQELIDAALRLIVQDGHHGVTFRTVAAEASASHGSVNYYFGSRSGLMCAAADDVCRRLAIRLEELAPTLERIGRDPDRFAAALSEHNIKYVIGDRALSIALYELTLAGARDEDIRGVMVRWGKVHSQRMRNAFLKLGSVNPEADYAFVLNSLNGLIVAQLAIPRRNFETQILRPSLLRLVRSIAATSRPAP
jgi:AcrR family transcriptional regulator